MSWSFWNCCRILGQIPSKRIQLEITFRQWFLEPLCLQPASTFYILLIHKYSNLFSQSKNHFFLRKNSNNRTTEKKAKTKTRQDSRKICVDDDNYKQPSCSKNSCCRCVCRKICAVLSAWKKNSAKIFAGRKKEKWTLLRILFLFRLCTTNSS